MSSDVKTDRKEAEITKETSADELRINTIPNKITGLRIAFVPVVVGLMFIRTEMWDWIAMGVFALASITDAIDGYVARAYKSVSIFGKLMDPLADKFLVVSAMIMLQYLGRLHPFVVIVLVCREFAITGLRTLAISEGVVIAASNSAKIKTATQMVGIPMLMVGRKYWFLDFDLFGTILIYISMIISITSANDYIMSFFRNLKLSRAKAAERRIAKKKIKILRRLKRKEKIKRLLDKYLHRANKKV